MDRKGYDSCCCCTRRSSIPRPVNLTLSHPPYQSIPPVRSHIALTFSLYPYVFISPLRFHFTLTFPADPYVSIVPLRLLPFYALTLSFPYSGHQFTPTFPFYPYDFILPLRFHFTLTFPLWLVLCHNHFANVFPHACHADR